MNQFIALYLKEVRAQRLVAGVMLIATLGLAFYALTGIGDEPSPRLALVVLPYASALGLPFLLIHSISSEWTGQTHYQILALPVPRWSVLLAKVAVVLSLGLVIFICSTAFLQVIAQRMAQIVIAHDFQQISATDPSHIGAGTIWAFAGVVYGVMLLPLLGIACAASGVRVMAQRFKGLATLGVFAAGGYLFIKLQGPVVHVLQKVFGQWQLDLPLHNGVPPTSDAHLILMYAAVFAALMISIGALLFEEYVEA